MAAGMKRLAGDTAIYGLSSILGKILNWFLVPMYTRVLADTAEYGVVTNIYSWTALLMVILTYGMETGFFRFINRSDVEKPMQVYTATITSILFSSTVFVFLVLLFLKPISIVTGYANYPEFLGIMAVVVAVDAFCSIPFALLRYQGKAWRFAILKLINIGLAIFLNIFFLIICPWLLENYPATVYWFYKPGYSVGYVFVANAITTFVTLLLLWPELRLAFKEKFNPALLRRIFNYSLPIVLLGIAGIFNQTADKILFPFLFTDQNYAISQLGIYGACSKIAVIMVMFIQAFRYAYEPFIFAQKKNNAQSETYSQAMKYFIILSLAIFIGVMFYIDIIKHFVEEKYYPGLRVVPIVMLGEFFFGVYFNLSFWYKLIDKTQWGAYFSLTGCILTVAIIFIFGPVYGYMACAWASFISNLVMMLLSYIVGQQKNPIKYDLKSAAIYFLLAGVLYFVGMYAPIENQILRLAYRTFLLLIYLGFTIRRDLPLKEIPFINRFIK